MEKIINLLPASSLSDLECRDGEVENAGFLFDSDSSAEGSSSVGGSVSSYSFRLSESVQPPSPVSFPAMASFLCMHHPPGAESPHAVALLQDGTLVFSSPGGVSPFVAEAVAAPVAWLPVATRLLNGVRKAVAVGEWLVVLTSESLLYACWRESGYVWMGEAPLGLDVSFAARPRALPPFSSSDAEFPVITVSVDIGSDSSSDVLDWLAGNSAVCSMATRRNILDSVGAGLSQFVDSVRAAGLHISPVRAVACRSLPDRTLWQPSGSFYVSPESVSEAPVQSAPISLKISSAGVSGGVLYMNLLLSRQPFEVEAMVDDQMEGFEDLRAGVEVLVNGGGLDFNPSDVSYPIRLDGVSRGFQIAARLMKESDFGASPVVRKSVSAEGVPDDLFSIAGRLLCLYSAGAERRFNAVAVSVAAFPQVADGSVEIGGGSIFYITRSLRSVSSASFGEFPLLAFGSDGIRALYPHDGGFRDVQLISRDVALGKNSFAPLPDGTCFVTESGVMKIKGTSVSLLSKSLKRDFSQRDRLVFLYRDNCLLLYRPGVVDIKVCDLNSGKWIDSRISLVSHHYAWPVAWVVSGSSLGILEKEPAEVLRTVSQSVEAAGTEGVPVSVRTRPIKLGSAFAQKQLEWIEGQWPDGSLWPVKVYGALKLGRWHFLGCATRGRMRMRGSGWRFFIIETFVPHADGKYHLPVFRLLTKNC